MKIHYALHILMLGTIVYLTAQVTDTPKSNIEMPMLDKSVQTGIDTSDSQIERLNKKIAMQDKSIKLLEKSNDIANDKINGLKREIDELVTENKDLQKTPLRNIEDPVKSITDALKATRLSPKKNLKKFYGPLFTKLNLNEEEQQEFIELVMGGEGSPSKFIMINGVPFTGSNNQVSDELKNFLGNDLPVYEKYKKSAMERSQINTMNNNLSDENKLTQDEQEVLVDLLHERKQQKSQGNTMSDEEYLESSADFLNDSQKDAFRKQLKSPITIIKSSSISINQ